MVPLWAKTLVSVNCKLLEVFREADNEAVKTVITYQKIRAGTGEKDFHAVMTYEAQ